MPLDGWPARTTIGSLRHGDPGSGTLVGSLRHVNPGVRLLVGSLRHGDPGSGTLVGSLRHVDPGVRLLVGRLRHGDPGFGTLVGRLRWVGPRFGTSVGRLGNPSRNLVVIRSSLWPAAPAGVAEVPSFDRRTGSLWLDRCRLPPGSSWGLLPGGSLPAPAPSRLATVSRSGRGEPRVCALVRSRGGGILGL